ncbi:MULTISPECIES: hypothetical protein [unclassified Acinetobacter]|uniref:hypothetical protein n=1 Tax=unclassified Acinetobacter TaxID=196816 RepID=UPI00103DC2B6|nr:MULTISPECIES: hypothetical protein [unclassified Acinetobacter]TCB11473.1 hypothetical protein E0H78_07525 [Acinetobacter sp. ANC 4641]TCB32221.1 hypothetical protein E0H86_07345 [Acinetobacter sp. ANC 4635]
MSEVKVIFQLPELQPHQEWACEQGCTVHKPKLHKNVYAQSWDLDGKLIRELSEKYWTCQRGHLLMVWDNNINDYVELDVKHYEEQPNESE